MRYGYYGSSNKLLIFIDVVFFLIFLIQGIWGLADKDSHVEVNIDYAYTALEHVDVTRGIPSGKEYYYIGINTEEETMYLIRADKKWLAKNFDPETHTAHNQSVKVKARAVDTKDKIYQKLKNINSTDNLKFVTGTSVFYDAIYVRVAVMKLIGAAVLVFMTGTTYIFMRSNVLWKKSWFAHLWLFGLLAGMVYLIILLTYI